MNGILSRGVRPFVLVVFSVFALAATACTPGLGPNDVPRAEAGAVNRIKEGVIIESRIVNIEGSKSGVGSGAGTVSGAIIGGQFGGGGAENLIGSIAGAILGGLAGSAVEESTTRRVGYAYTIRLDEGGLISVAQADEVPLASGTRVFIELGRRARVVAQQDQS